MVMVRLELEAEKCVRILTNHGGYKSGQCISCLATGWIDQIRHEDDCPVGQALAKALTEGTAS